MPLQAADPAAERQPGDPGVADHADRADEAVRLRGHVELAEERAAVRPRGPRRRADLHAAHRGHVDDESAVLTADPRVAVPAGPDGDLQVVLAPEPDRGRDLVGARRADEHRRSPVVHRVPQPARVVVGGIVGRDDVAAERAAQLLEMAWREPGAGVDHRVPPGVA